jgi:hypothetical protein
MHEEPNNTMNTMMNISLPTMNNCDAPGFWLASLALMAESAEPNRPTLVKPRSTWLITSKTSTTNPIEPLDQVYTHPWSTFGQRHGQTPLKTLMSANVFQNFCHVLRISPKLFKIHLYESCPACWGTQLSCRLAFPILSGNWWKPGQLVVPPVHRTMAAFKVCQQFMQNPLRKTPYSLCESCRG